MKKLISNFQFLAFSRKGFTLIEFLVAFSIMAMLATFGLASYVNYSRMQTMNTAAYDVITMLNKAKSMAMSQAIQKGENNMCGNDSFKGFAVLICGLGGSLCQDRNDENKTNANYEFDIVCGGNDSIANTNNPIENKKVPSEVEFKENSSTFFLFKSVVGGVKNGGNITLQGFGDIEKTIEVDSAGNINIVQ
ncbi:MAG: prepilin-type N-terminal cleavage/methylation domain-containing protein [Candidatus Levyibacteriota bacterium]